MDRALQVRGFLLRPDCFCALKLLRLQGAEPPYLPEFFCTGFTSNTAMAEDPDGPTMRWMQALAGSSGAAVTGSVPVRTGERVVNRMYFICPDGRTESYDKRHLFRMSGENEVFAPHRYRGASCLGRSQRSQPSAAAERRHIKAAPPFGSAAKK